MASEREGLAWIGPLGHEQEHESCKPETGKEGRQCEKRPLGRAARAARTPETPSETVFRRKKLRLAKKLGVLGLLAGLVAVLGLLAAGRTPTSAQVVIQDCSGPGAAPSVTITCTFPTIESIPTGG